MEKYLWLILAVLWSSLLGGAAMGADVARLPGIASPTGSLSVDRTAVLPANMTRVATPVSNAVDLRAVRVTSINGQIVVLGSGGGTELLGGIIASGLLVHYARRHRFI